MSATKLTKAEIKDRTVLRHLRDNPRALNVRGGLTRLADAATITRLERREWIARPDNYEFTDQLAITPDGMDYLAELEQPWITN